MTDSVNLRRVQAQFAEGKLSRRGFLRYATLLGVAAPTAYAMAGLPAARAAENAAAELPKGGTLRIGMPVPAEVKDPHAMSWYHAANIARQVCEYLTITPPDNVTRPYLLESWEASDDLRTWRLHVRKEAAWHSGRPFTAEDAAWNLRRMLDPQTGSSMLGLMQSYMLSEEDGQQRLWDANAIEVADSHTLVLNLKQPQIALPEHLFHYPALMLDPEEDGRFGVGSNGTGRFTLSEHRTAEQAVLQRRAGHWARDAYLDELRFIDLGDDPSAAIAALGSGQIDGIDQADVTQLAVLQALPEVRVHEVLSSATGVLRMRVDKPPFDDPRVRRALRLAIDPQRVLELAHQGRGAPGEHHHVAPVHPAYASLPAMPRDVEAARALLAEAGYPEGLDLPIDVSISPEWELSAVQVMKDMMAPAGIRLQINTMPSAQYWDIWLDTPLGFTNWGHRPLGTMSLGLGYRSGAPWNETRYANPEFDRLLDEAEASLDVERRREVMAEIQRLLQEDGPVVQPLWRAVFAAYHQKVKGVRMHPSFYIQGDELAIEA